MNQCLTVTGPSTEIRELCSERAWCLTSALGGDKCHDSSHFEQPPEAEQTAPNSIPVFAKKGAARKLLMTGPPLPLSCQCWVPGLIVEVPRAEAAPFFAQPEASQQENPSTLTRGGKGGA